VRTAESFKKIVESKTGLVLINNVPEGLKPGDYITCVSVNERENGHNAGKLLGELFKNEEDVKIGLICHGAPFFATRQRDFAAEQVIIEQFRNITIAAKENFIKEKRVYNICRDMIKVIGDRGLMFRGRLRSRRCGRFRIWEGKTSPSLHQTLTSMWPSTWLKEK
jgi:ribose transport system substrate-binding protein